MNQLLIVVILLMISIICYSQDSQKNSDGYRIEGHIVGLAEESKIYLINGEKRKRIDSAIVRDNRFLMTGKLDEPAHMYLYSGKTTKLADILLDNREIEVNGNAPIYDSIQIKGSDIDLQWKEWYHKDQIIGYQKYRLDKVYESLTEKKDSDNAVIVKTLSEELMTDRINLLKTYVNRYNDSVSGAILPTLCTIQTSLTNLDYMEMYEALTPRMRSTTFGKEILRLAEKAKLKPNLK